MFYLGLGCRRTKFIHPSNTNIIHFPSTKKGRREGKVRGSILIVPSRPSSSSSNEYSTEDWDSFADGDGGDKKNTGGRPQTAMERARATRRRHKGKIGSRRASSAPPRRRLPAGGGQDKSGVGGGDGGGGVRRTFLIDGEDSSSTEEETSSSEEEVWWYNPDGCEERTATSSNQGML